MTLGYQFIVGAEAAALDVVDRTAGTEEITMSPAS